MFLVVGVELQGGYKYITEVSECYSLLVKKKKFLEADKHKDMTFLFMEIAQN